MWTISSGDNPINLDQIQQLLIVEDGGAADIDSTNIARLRGSWATKAEAIAAASRMVDLVDLADYE